MKTVTILALVLLLLGCGPQTNRQAKKSGANQPASSKSSKSGTKPKPPLTVDADSFAGIPEAITALTEAAKSRDDNERIRADMWLAMQGEAAIEPLANVVNDEQAHLAARIATCRVLRRLGPKAKPALKQALGSGPERMRLNAIEALGFFRDPDVIQTLVDLMDAEDEQMRLHAVLAVSRIGPPAKEMCTDKLVAILNDAEENETLRDAAKRALKKVNPRRNLTD